MQSQSNCTLQSIPYNRENIGNLGDFGLETTDRNRRIVMYTAIDCILDPLHVERIACADMAPAIGVVLRKGRGMVVVSGYF
jgi:hypothetical protein